jgi:hypothetical protein
LHACITMARIYYQNADGDYIRDDDDAYMTGEPEDCCCVVCIEGEEPTADYSYQQTDDDPCTFDLFDESTVHANCEGSIVSRAWYKNAETTPFSTDQNPTGVALDDGDDVRLVVTDSCGCTDEVVGAVECVPLTIITCGGQGFILPATMLVNFPSLTDGTYNQCNEISGSQVLTFNNFSSGNCAHPGHALGPCCLISYLGEDQSLNIAVPLNSDPMRVIAELFTNVSGYQWEDVIPKETNFTGWSSPPLPLIFSGVAGQCNGVAGSTATVVG